ncbi:MAG TPA: DUF5063 domain-containing protein [Gammaproteobacteria bacterium]|nr:DUF5063 domain-containing protein [Gammaproteobacteria bacterium]
MTKPEQARFQELVDAARQYCRLIEARSDRTGWLHALMRVLPRLHAGIADLHGEQGYPLPAGGTDLDDRFVLFSRLSRRLGELDRYWLEYDQPGGAGRDDRSGSLADDLTDIYFELRHGLDLLEAAGDEEVARLWECGFHRHWGQHLVDAERHLYHLRASNRLS